MGVVGGGSGLKSRGLFGLVVTVTALKTDLGGTKSEDKINEISDFHHFNVSYLCLTHRHEAESNSNGNKDISLVPKTKLIGGCTSQTE